jgi:ribosomal protein S18 acetylase RimI-like enzyme
MFKRLTVSDKAGNILHPVTIRNYAREDFAKLIGLQALCFPPPFPEELWWNEAQLEEHISRFPAGALCAEINGTIVGSMTALRMTPDDGHHLAWSAATNDGYIRNHDPKGDTVYVVDIAVAPDFRQFGIGKWLTHSMYETVVYLGCRRLLGGGRMPGYKAVSHRLTPEQYVEDVSTGVRKDPVLTFLMRCGRMPIGIVMNYLEDEQSLNYAALMEWRNPFIEEKSNGIYTR